jgi:signal transduction histidine kinase
MNYDENTIKKEKAIILIVDDNKLNLEILHDFLEDEFIIITASNGKTALEKVKKEVIDLILLDIMMPDIDGYEVCSILKNDPLYRRIPIIMVTAKSDLDDKIKGLDIGADDYVVKPYNFDELLARIHSHLRIYKLQEEITKTRIENELNTLKLDFLSIVSHELLTPLHSILGFSELILTEGSISEKYLKYIKEIRNGGVRLKELINNLLLYTQISANLYEKDIQDIDVANQIQDIKDILSDKLSMKNIILNTEVENGLILQINPDIFNEIMFKTIGNAIKFSKPNSSITVSAYTKGDLLVMKVSDFGIGISDEVRDSIFKLFTQARDSYKNRPYEGLGLGLALVQRLVQHINGNITVEKNHPKGSTFVITIPIK